MPGLSSYRPWGCWALPFSFHCTATPVSHFQTWIKHHITHAVWSGNPSVHPVFKWCNPKGQRSEVLSSEELGTIGNESGKGCAGSYALALPPTAIHGCGFSAACRKKSFVLGRRTCQAACRVSLCLALKEEHVQWYVTSLCFVALPTPYSHFFPPRPEFVSFKPGTNTLIPNSCSVFWRTWAETGPLMFPFFCT